MNRNRGGSASRKPKAKAKAKPKPKQRYKWTKAAYPMFGDCIEKQFIEQATGETVAVVEKATGAGEFAEWWGSCWKCGNYKGQDHQDWRDAAREVLAHVEQCKTRG